MNSVCVAATGCLDVQTPIRKISFKKLYQWPESEAEFLNKLIITMSEGNSDSSTSTSSCSAVVSASPSFSHQNKPTSNIDHHESFVCRQRYLKSYTFSKQKETMTEKTMRWIKEKLKKKKKEKKNRNIHHHHHHHHEEKSKDDHEKYGFDHHHDDINGGSGSSNPCSSTFKSAFLFLLSCMVKVDVHDE